MGLKAYDLVWIEGKSAAWRYPGEIEEFKSFAPPVEEQPFDRFFKRPAQTNQPLFSSASSTNKFLFAGRTQHAVPVKREAEPFVQPKRSAYINSPAPRCPVVAAEMKNNFPAREPIVFFEQDVPTQRNLGSLPKSYSSLLLHLTQSGTTENFSQGYQERKESRGRA